MNAQTAETRAHTGLSQLWPVLAVALLALPFDPFWLSFESARRGAFLLWTAILLAGLGVAWTRTRRPPSPPAIQRPGTVAGCLLLATAGWFLLHPTSVTATEPIAGRMQGAYLLALGILFFAARNTGRGAWQVAALTSGLLVGGYTLLQAFGIIDAVFVRLWEQWPKDPAVRSDSQVFWLELIGFGRRDPVGTLGNRNVASEFLAVCAAVMAPVLARGEDDYRGLRLRRLWWLGLGIVVAALVANGSRSGLVAAPIALGITWARRGIGPRARTRLVAAVLFGLGIGILSYLIGPRDAGRRGDAALARTELTESTTAAEEGLRPPSTLAVRLAIWQSCVDMIAEQPIVGHGPAAFAREYPRFRSQAEIELSSFGRRFSTRVERAHNDYLELAVDGGLVGGGLWLSFMLLLAIAARGSRAALAPLATFAVLMLVRAPLWSAPTAALVIGAAASGLRRPVLGSAATSQSGARWWLALIALSGVLGFGYAGVRTLAAERAGAEYLELRKGDRPRASRLTALERGRAWRPEQLAFHSLLAQERFADAAAGEDRRPDGEIAKTIDTHFGDALRIDPANANLWTLRGRARHAASDPAAAIGHAQRALQLDPGAPDAKLLLAELMAQQGKHAMALSTLFDHPGPRLRRELVRSSTGGPGILGQFEQVFAGNDPAAATVYRIERLYLEAIDGLLGVARAMRSLNGEPTSTPELPKLPDEVTAFAEAVKGQRDPRALALLATYGVLLDNDKGRAQAATAAQRAATMPRMSRTDVELLGALLPRLRTVEDWQPLLLTDR